MLRRARRIGAFGVLTLFCLGMGGAGLVFARVVHSEMGSFEAGSYSDPARALRAALEARDRGDYREAARAFGRIAREHPAVGDHAELLLARMRVAQKKPREAAAACSEALELYPDSPLKPHFLEMLGDARSQRGDGKGAREAWRAALGETRSSEDRRRIELAIARSLDEDEQTQAAFEAYRELWIHHSDGPEVELALARLEVLEARSPRTRRNGADWRKRGDQLFRDKHNELALAAYEEALGFDLKKSEDYRTRNQRAHTLFRMRRYPEALEAFTALPQKDDVPLWRARSMARSGQVMESVELFEQLAERSKGELGIRAIYLAGLLLDGRGKLERAQSHFERVSRNRVSSGLRDAALWRLGWGAYRERKDADAKRYFDRLLERDGDPIGALRTRYWRARTLERLGKPEAAAEFAKIAREYPLSYYGWRARARIDDRSFEALPVELDVGRSKLGASDLDRPRVLLAAGLRAEAIDEIRRAARRARSLDDRRLLAQLFREVGEFHEAQRLIVNAYTEDLARGPIPHHEEIWWHAWPAAYEHDVLLSTNTPKSVEPALVYAIMREESGYRPRVLSPSGARGLLQIMVPTGEQLARRLGETGFEANDLFVPSKNIRYGAHYLMELVQRFDGRLSASIASYNAGPEAVSTWLGPDAPIEDDEWVEAIPYDQTRSYVKRVMRSYHAYRVLY